MLFRASDLYCCFTPGAEADLEALRTSTEAGNVQAKQSTYSKSVHSSIGG